MHMEHTPLPNPKDNLITAKYGSIVSNGVCVHTEKLPQGACFHGGGSCGTRIDAVQPHRSISCQVW